MLIGTAGSDYVALGNRGAMHAGKRLHFPISTLACDSDRLLIAVLSASAAG